MTDSSNESVVHESTAHVVAAGVSGAIGAVVGTIGTIVAGPAGAVLGEEAAAKALSLAELVTEHPPKAGDQPSPAAQ